MSKGIELPPGFWQLIKDLKDASEKCENRESVNLWRKLSEKSREAADQIEQILDEAGV